MIQVWTYVLEPPDGADVDEVGQLLAQHMSRMAAQSEEIIKAEVASQTMDDTTSLLLAVWFQGRDRWYIKKRIKFPVVAALKRSGMSLNSIRSTQVATPTDGRVNRTPRKPPPPRWAPIDY